MLSIRRTLWQWHPALSTIPAISVLLRRYHRPSAATLRWPKNVVDDLAPLRSLTPLAASRLPTTSHHSLLLLATPLLAPSVSNDRQWLIAILNQLYAAVPKLEFSLRVGVAVVDSLPAPKQICRDDCLPSGNPLLPRSGFDGVAYVLGDSNLFKGFSPDGPKAGTVSFTLQHRLQHKSYAYEVHVPLANTTFVVGRDAVSMVVDFEKPTGLPFREISSVDTRNIAVAWPHPIQSDGPCGGPSGGPSDGPSDGNLTLSAPLLPLTPPRKILAGMGNVVRRIAGSETNASAVPASSEFESAVTSFFETTNLPPSPISAWALVTPAEMHESHKANIPSLFRGSLESLQTLWKTSASVPDSDFLPHLQHGARLHRVLGGGGGWGQKAGLLALDPLAHFEPSHFANDPDSASFGEAMLGDAARIGDYIQFFISRAQGTKAEPPLGYVVRSRLWSLHVGTIPSTIDQLPTEGKPSEAAESKHDAFFPDHFGVLSEKGLSIRISPVEPGTQPPIRSNRSKVDVPFSLFAAQRLSWISTAHLNHPPGKEQRYDNGSSSRHIRNLHFLTRCAELRLISYARIAADTLHFQSSQARSKFNQFFELAGIRCNKKLDGPSTLHTRYNSHEDLWEMVNSAMQLEIEARRSSQALYRLELQVLTSERWITQIKPWLIKASHIRKRKIQNRNWSVRLKPVYRVRRVVSGMTRPPSGRNVNAPLRRVPSGMTSPPSGSSVNEDASSDEVWDLVNEYHPPVAKNRARDRNRRQLQQNLEVADQVAKLLDGFQP